MIRYSFLSGLRRTIAMLGSGILLRCYMHMHHIIEKGLRNVFKAKGPPTWEESGLEKVIIKRKRPWE